MSTNSATSRSLFHYTTADGLRGIVQNQTLFATHYQYLNDSAECNEIIAGVIQPRIKAELDDLVPKLIERKIISKKVYEEYGRRAHEEEARSIFNTLLQATDHISPFFITSFCIHDPNKLEYENGLLSQWRGYGQNGFALEFDELEIDALNRKEQEHRLYQGILTESVVYQDYASRVQADDFSGIAAAAIRNLINEVDDSIRQLLGTREIVEFVRPFLTAAPFLKDPGFMEENEYRIVALCNRPGSVPEGEERPLKEILFRPRSDGQLVPYIELYSDISARLPIKSILVGPHPRQLTQKLSLELLLEQNKLDIPIRLSKIPFRGG